MRFPELQRGTLIRRYKRFLADVVLEDGETVTAHCPNTGAMTGCAEPGYSVWLSKSSNPRRKLAWTLEVVESPQGAICVHSALANGVVAEALDEGQIPALSGYDTCRREVPYGNGSRVDFRLDWTSESTWVEVKAVTLLKTGGLGLFPDTVSERARRHVEELLSVRREGARAAMVFCALHSGIEKVAPAAVIDPEYTRVLREAVGEGLEVYGLGTEVSATGITVTGPIPVEGLA